MSGIKDGNKLQIFIVALITFIVLGVVTTVGGYFYFKADSSSKYEEYHGDESEGNESSVNNDVSVESGDKDEAEATGDNSNATEANEATSVNVNEMIQDKQSQLQLIAGTTLQKFVKAKGYEMEYTFDASPVGSLGYRSADFDGDGDNELLVVDVESNGRIVLNMYDYSAERDDIGVATYPAGNYNIQDMGQLDIFAYEYMGRQIIGVYDYFLVFMSADGVGVDARFLEYTGDGFVENDSASYAGSDGFPNDTFEPTCSKYGINIDWDDIFCGRSGITKFAPDGSACMIARVYQPSTNKNIFMEVNENSSIEFDKTYLGGFYNPEAVEYSKQHSFEGQAEMDYMIPESNSRYLTEADLMELSKDELRIARNEILARHGRRFKDSELQMYFDLKQWYVGYIEANDFNENVLSDIESANMYFIKAFENDYDKYH